MIIVESLKDNSVLCKFGDKENKYVFSPGDTLVITMILEEEICNHIKEKMPNIKTSIASMSGVGTRRKHYVSFEFVFKRYAYKCNIVENTMEAILFSRNLVIRPINTEYEYALLYTLEKEED